MTLRNKVTPGCIAMQRGGKSLSSLRIYAAATIYKRFSALCKNLEGTPDAMARAVLRWLIGGVLLGRMSLIYSEPSTSAIPHRPVPSGRLRPAEKRAVE